MDFLRSHSSQVALGNQNDECLDSGILSPLCYTPSQPEKHKRQNKRVSGHREAKRKTICPTDTLARVCCPEEKLTSQKQMDIAYGYPVFKAALQDPASLWLQVHEPRSLRPLHHCHRLSNTLVTPHPSQP